MKCPLLVMGTLANNNMEPAIYERSPIFSPNFSGNDCLKVECAWWDEFEKECCVRSMKAVLYDISSDMAEIRLKKEEDAPT